MGLNILVLKLIINLQLTHFTILKVMKKILIFLFSLSFFTVSSAKDFSEFFNNFVPGEGLTEAQIDFTDADDEEITFNTVSYTHLRAHETS